MKTIVLPFFLALASTAASHAAIVITEVMSSSAHGGGTNNGDWFELTNTGSSAVNITGWTWNDNDASGSPGNFGTLTSIGAGQSVIILEEADAATWLSNWGLTGVTAVGLGGTVFQGLGAGGDSVIVYDNLGAVVASVTFGTASQGFSFEYNTSGNSLALSVLGENGAIRAAANGQTTGPGAGVDIGSPGTVVPEPSSALLGGLGALAFLSRRRKE